MQQKSFVTDTVPIMFSSAIYLGQQCVSYAEHHTELVIPEKERKNYYITQKHHHIKLEDWLNVNDNSLPM